MEEIRPSISRLKAAQKFKEAPPQATAGDDIDVYSLLEFHRTTGNKFSSCLIYQIADAIYTMPELNVSWRDENREKGTEAKIIKYDTLNLGMAFQVFKKNELTSTAVARIREEIQGGFEICPWNMIMSDFNRTISALTQKAAQNRLFGKDFVPHPNIIFNNLGAFKHIGFVEPLMPFGSSLMITVLKSEEKAVIRKGYIRKWPMMTLKVTFDHRLFDGPAINKFIGLLKENIENPRF
ncbi:MAG: 2-oxo acid dehydrogenase subunit E2 [bacterium]|nr:2-oxo acid dehydrogenase subunit E2 [bacterium]